MALTRVSRHIIDEPLELQNINATGIGTFASLRVTGDLQVDGTTTTLDTVVTEVDRLEVSANNSTVGAAITQTGSGDILNLYDGSTEVFTVTDGGKVGIEAPNPSGNLNISYLQIGKGQVSSDHSLYNYNTSFTNNAYQNGNGTFAHITSRAVGVINIQDNVLTFSNGPGGTAGQSATLTERLRIDSSGVIRNIGNTSGTYENLLLTDGTSNSTTKRFGINCVHYNTAEEDFTIIHGASSSSENVIKIGGNSSATTTNDATNIRFYTAADQTTTSSTERLRITSDGKVRVPDNGKFVAGDGDDLQIYHESASSSNFISASPNLKILTDTFRLNNAANNNNIIVADAGSGVDLYFNNSKKLETVSTGILVTGQVNASTMHLTDGNGIHIGNSNDLRIYHDGNNSAINDVGTGNLYIQGSDSIYFRDYDTSENHMVLNKNGSVDLYHNGSQKFETTSDGATITGELGFASGGTYQLKLSDNQKIRFGGGNDLQIFHDGSNNYIQGNNGNIILKNSTGDYFVGNVSNGAAEVYYNNSKKLETTTTGAKVTGALEVTQEYPSIRPTLDLNFAATKTLDRRITFRRDSIGTFTGEDGLVKYASNNVPRFDHDPTTRESLGLLIEESRTNLAEYGTIVGDTGWYNRPAFNTTLNDSVAPDGRTTATKITNLNAESDADLYSFEQYAIGSNKTITHSIYIKSPDATNVGKEIHFRGKRISGTSSSWSQKFILTAEWQRVTVTHTYQADNTTGRAYIGSDPNGSNPAGEATACLFWGLQVEEGSFATSFIPTYGSTVTRAQDTAKITGSNFTDFYNQTEGTLVAHYYSTVDDNYISAFELSSSPSDNRIALVNYSAYQGFVRNGGTTQASLDNGTPTVGGINKVVLAFKENDFTVSLNGATPAADTGGTMPTVDRMMIGSRAGGTYDVLKSTIRHLSYYPKRLPNAQLQGLTQQ